MNTLEAGGRERKEEKAMSLRKIAKILGISPTYLSLLLNGKRPWRGKLWSGVPMSSSKIVDGG